MNSTRNSSIGILLVAVAAVTFSLAVSAQAQTETVLFNVPGGTLGSTTEGGLVFDQAGNLYGTASAGGDTTNCTSGCGLVFELSPTTSGAWKETVLHTFTGASAADGFLPTGNLIFDAAGNLYGTTYYGGASKTCPQGCGTVYKMSRDAAGMWKETILHSFTGLGDGSIPNGGVTLDAAGNLYGTTAYAGLGASGVVYRLSKASGSWRESVLYSFQGHADGSRPVSTLTFDATGNLYGTTEAGGANYGTVFELSPTSTLPWKETVLHSFSSSNDGQYPIASVVFDAAGNLWGATALGGSNFGTIFKLSPTSSGAWTETFVPFNFTNGSEPVSNLIFDAAGNLYGTTQFGGTGSNGGDGVVFEITP